jgi:acetolactate synthase I/II/III large subunit
LLVAEVMAQKLKEAGITEIFGFPGGEILEFVEQCRRQDVPYVLTRHESSAAFRADVTGQITGRPGVCCATLGPGATNLVTGVANAYLDRSPVIVVTAQIPSTMTDTITHQRLDLKALYQPVTKWAVRVTPENVGAVMDAAIAVAMRRPRGPVYLELPSDVAKMEAALPGRLGPNELPPAELQPSTVTLSSAAARLNSAKRPVLLVGPNANPRAVAGPVRALAEKGSIPVALSPKAKGVFRADHPLFIGTAAGMAADAEVMAFLKQSDLILGVGFEATEADGNWPALLPILWLDEAPREKAEWDGDYLLGDLPGILGALAEGCTGPHEWTPADLEAVRAAVAARVAPNPSPTTGLSPTAALRAMRTVLPENAILTTDVGAHKLLAGQVWDAYEPLTFFMSNGLSSMGYGMPAALAAKAQFPERTVVSLVGDGGFAMTAHDLEVARRSGQAVIFVLFDDTALTLIQVSQNKKGHPRYGVDFVPSDYVQVAKGFGARACTVATLEELQAALRRELNSTDSVVIHVPVDASEYRRQM